jgi:hypothetical protein
LGDEQKKIGTSNIMKYWSIITLTIFLNFTALPGLAAMFGWELPRTNVVISEEETHSTTQSLSTKKPFLKRWTSMIS